MFFWKKNKINKKFLGAKTVDVPKTAQKTIPFQEAYENGLFLNYDGSYSLIFSFENIDYSLYRDEEKQEIYKKYTQLINTIPTDIHFQEFLMNTDIDTGTLTETLLSASYDYPEISDDYNSIMNGVISGSTSSGAKKIMLMAMSYKPKGNIDNANVLFKYYQDLRQLFQSLGSTTHQLPPEQVFEVLYKFYHQFSGVQFMLPKNAYGNRIKNYVTPAYFRFNKQDIEIGDRKSMNNENNTQAASDYPEIPLKIIINNQLSLKEIGTFATVYDMYLNGEMPITVSGICQRTSDGIVTIRKYVKGLIDKELLIRDHALIDGHIVMTLTVNMDRFRE